MIYHLGLGSNMGKRLSQLGDAIDMLADIGSVRRISPVYETSPVGMESERMFLNLVLEFETDVSPHELLGKIIDHEVGTGRKRNGASIQDRPIDIDILLAENQIIADDNLVIPHINMHRRAFVLQPLLKIAADTRHPVLNQSIKQLAAAVPGTEIIKQVTTPPKWRESGTK